MKKKKIIITIGSSLALLAVFATATFFAIFQSGQKTEASMTTGIINVKLIEEFTGSNGGIEVGTDENSTGLENATKIIKGENIGTQPAYVRVKIFPQIEYYDTEIEKWSVFGGLSTNFVKYDIDNTNWIKSNGYFYYKNILPVGKITSPITITDLKIEIPEDFPTIYQTKVYRVNMLVQLESTQSSNELYKLNWSIDSLPVEVEQ